MKVLARNCRAEFEALLPLLLCLILPLTQAFAQPFGNGGKHNKAARGINFNFYHVDQPMVPSCRALGPNITFANSPRLRQYATPAVRAQSQADLRNLVQSGVTWARTGQGLVASEPFELCRIDRIGGHHGLPLGPLSIADLDRDRPAHRQPVTHPAEHTHRVGLELHPRAATVAETTASQLPRQLRGRDLHTRDHAVEHRDQGRPM